MVNIGEQILFYVHMNIRKGNSFKVLLLVSISRLNGLIPLKQLHNSENLGKFD